MSNPEKQIVYNRVSDEPLTNGQLLKLSVDTFSLYGKLYELAAPELHAKYAEPDPTTERGIIGTILHKWSDSKAEKRLAEATHKAWAPVARSATLPLFRTLHNTAKESDGRAHFQAGEWADTTLDNLDRDRFARVSGIKAGNEIDEVIHLVAGIIVDARIIEVPTLVAVDRELAAVHSAVVPQS